MTAQTPGVSIQELASTSLSVQASNTAVPVFIGSFFNLDGTPATGGQCIRVNSWLEFTKRFAESTVCSVTVPLHDMDLSKHAFSTDEIPPIKRKIKPKANTQGLHVDKVSASSCNGGDDLLFELEFNIRASSQDQLNAHVLRSGNSIAENIYNACTAQFCTDINSAHYTASLPSWDGGWSNPPIIIDVATQKIYIKINTPTDGPSSTQIMSLQFATMDDSPYHFDTGERTYASGYICYGIAPSFTTQAFGSFAVLSHFQNGGGPCYLLPLSAGDTAELAALPAVIEEYPDITLLVCPESDEGLIELGSSKNEVYSALSPLLTPDKGYLLIADAESEGVAPTALAGSDHVAVYYPNVVTSLKRNRPADEYITITGYTDSNGVPVNTLAALKVKKPSIYPVVSSAVDTFFAEQDYLTLPPSALMAGAYARTDRERGVWKAPANIPLKGVRGLETVVSEAAQGPLNEQGINVIRWFSDRGPVIYGARTLAVDSNDWRYVPVRRLFNMAERDIKRSLSTLVFEPNYQITWERARSAIYNYLAKLWRDGALQGDKEEEAFYVQVGLGITMTQEQIDAGQLIVKVGMAAVRPAEFIILQFTQDLQ